MTRTIGPATWAVASPPVRRLASAPVGAGLAVAVYAPERRHGGMACCLLPSAGDAAPVAGLNPATFVDAALAALIEALQGDGGPGVALVAALAGGGEPLGGSAACGIGARNVATARAILAGAGVPVVLAEIGGTRPRRLTLNVNEGQIHVQQGVAAGRLR